MLVSFGISQVVCMINLKILKIDIDTQILPANAQYAVPTHSFRRTKATSDIPPFITPTKNREMAKNSYEGENPFAMANKMSRAKPEKQCKRFNFRRASNVKQKQLLASLLDFQ